MIALIGRLLRDEAGSAIIEYALAASLMSAAMLAGVQVLMLSFGNTITILSDSLYSNEILGY